jgi:acyl-coenzyme A thioesterase PaaI-like protein
VLRGHTLAVIDSNVLNLYRKASAYPGGKKLFSLLFAWKAPYFASIDPMVKELRANYCEVLVRKQRKVLNHIGTVHVIAICNALEMAMGGLAEASIPEHLRWIPKGMALKYFAKATSDITAIAQVSPEVWLHGPDVAIPVKALRDDGTVVVEGTIHLWVTEKKTQK